MNCITVLTDLSSCLLMHSHRHWQTCHTVWTSMVGLQHLSLRHHDICISGKMCASRCFRHSLTQTSVKEVGILACSAFMCWSILLMESLQHRNSHKLVVITYVCDLHNAG